MSKVGILTFQNTLNYGAALQCYALYRTLRELGHEPMVIDYRNPQIARNEGLTYSWCHPRSVLAYAKRQKRVRAFDAFRSRVHFTEPCDRGSIASVCEGLDYVVVGSDQVWNPQCMSDDPSYFLDFMEDASKKKSYAASIGGSETVTDAFDPAKLLDGFTSLLLRERSGADYVASIIRSGIVPQVVLDPTLLLTGEGWKALAMTPKEVAGTGGYVLLYSISEKERAVQAVNRIAEETGCSRVELASGEREPLPGMEGAAFLQFTRPEGFLGLFAGARHAVVSSFHGVCFCILNHLDFYYSLPPTTKGSVNNRVLDLVGALGIDGRTVNELMPGKAARIDWESVDGKLACMRKRSVGLLESSLVR